MISRLGFLDQGLQQVAATDLADEASIAQYGKTPVMTIEEKFRRAHKIGIRIDGLSLRAHILQNLAAPVLVITGTENNLEAIFLRQYADEYTGLIDHVYLNNLARGVRTSYSRAGDYDDSPVALDRNRLSAALGAYFNLHEISADWEAIDETPDERLVTSLSMICPFDPTEKQALLEAPTLADRAEMMISLVEMAIHAPSGDAPARH